MVLLACQKVEENPVSSQQNLAIETIDVTTSGSKGESYASLTPGDLLELKPQEGLVYYQGRPFTGISVAYYPDGEKAETIEYLNGKKHGLYKKWFEHGALSFESHYSAGKQHGLTKSWWSNGNLRTASHYEEGVPHGIQKQWYKSGARFKQMQLVFGKEEGLQQSWRENGKIYNNYEAKNGRIFGLKRANLCYELEDENIQYKD
ncbi:MAG: hypothetical protein DHS20C18_31790 [Saprospiraceae bacterium]|nr:MAG: hypothetical protein DHS20C18_31790 [Saprospiraceae bacterium]